MAVPAITTGKNGKAQFNLKGEQIDLGKPESFRYEILMKVIQENYGGALADLNELIHGPSEYPDFREKTERYVQHAIELVQAIKAKRNFAGMDSLTSAKQQELVDQFKSQIKVLQNTLKTVEKIQGDLRVQDVRTTIYVVQAFWYAMLSLTVFAFILDLFSGLLGTTLVAGDGFLSDIAHFIATKVGF
jgi:hypothetical protein